MRSLYLLLYLLSPTDAGLPLPDPDWPALVVFSELHELTDERTRWTYTDWRADLNWVRRYYHECRDMPPLADADVLPPAWVVEQALASNAAWCGHLHMRLGLDYWDRTTLLNEAEALVAPWRTIRDARDLFSYPCSRRLALGRLRELLGDGYYGRQWHWPVPVWRFQWEE